MCIINAKCVVCACVFYLHSSIPMENRNEMKKTKCKYNQMKLGRNVQVLKPELLLLLLLVSFF